MGYLFRRLDNEQVVEVSFRKMMQQDSAGYIRLAGGVLARRCVGLERERDGEANPEKAKASSVDKPIVSSALGFTETQLADFAADRDRHGFSGVEFVRDKHVPQFFNVQFAGSRKEWQRYIKHRGHVDNNSRLGSGNVIGAAELAGAQKLIRDRYPESAGKIVTSVA